MVDLWFIAVLRFDSSNSELTRALDNSAKLLTQVWSSRDTTSRSEKDLSTTALSLLLGWVACYPARRITQLFAQARTDVVCDDR